MGKGNIRWTQETWLNQFDRNLGEYQHAEGALRASMGCHHDHLTPVHPRNWGEDGLLPYTIMDGDWVTHACEDDLDWRIWGLSCMCTSQGSSPERLFLDESHMEYAKQLWQDQRSIDHWRMWLPSNPADPSVLDDIMEVLERHNAV